MIPVNVNSDSGMLNTVSGKEGKVFRLSRNERSHWSGNGVHVESELVFMIGGICKPMSLQALLTLLSSLASSRMSLRRATFVGGHTVTPDNTVGCRFVIRFEAV